MNLCMDFLKDLERKLNQMVLFTLDSFEMDKNMEKVNLFMQISPPMKVIL